jgi:hypothetical protein
MATCKAITAKKTQCSRNAKDGEYCKTHANKSAGKNQVAKQDTYTETVLREEYDTFKSYYMTRLKLKNHQPIRLPNIPEDISENIVKFIIQNKLGDKSALWCKGVGMTGDIYSDVTQINEVKAYCSEGPSSFGPNKVFNVMYFLNMRDFMNDVIVLECVSLSNESAEWKNIKMNKTETHEDKSEKGQRPRMSFEKMRLVIPEFITKVYEGSFEGIFTAQSELEPTD